MVLIASLVVAVVISTSSGGEPQPAPPALVVDHSAAACDDARPPAQVSPAQPWCTLTRAVAASPPGSTISVRGRGYGPLTIAGRTGLTLRAESRASLQGLLVTNSTRVRIDGFRITDVTQIRDSREVAMRGNDVSPQEIDASGGGGLVFERNRLHDMTIDRSQRPCAAPRCGYGMRISGVSGLVIRDNVLRRIPADGLQLSGVSNVTIEGNRFRDISAFIDPEVHSDGIQVIGGADGLVIRRNVFRATRGVLAQPREDGTGVTRGLVVENNLFARCRDFGLNLIDTPGARIFNNTVWECGGGVTLSGAAMKGVVLQNNILQRLRAQRSMLSVEDWNIVSAGPRFGSHTRRGRPGFAPGYRLAPGSAAVDSGSSRGAPATDFAGRRRVDQRGVVNSGGGGRRYYDRGAFERQPRGG